ncbi:MAG: phosphoenolpyruvate carboxykinase (ATP) [Actinomycetota bacterium]
MSKTSPHEVATIARSVRYGPSEEELRALTDAMPNARQTLYGNVNVATQVGARQRSSTFLVSDEPERYTDPTISRAEGERVAALQDRYLATQDVIVIDGFIGSVAPHRTHARLVVEKANVNIAAMQRHLLYDPGSDTAPSAPELTVICTPHLAVPGYVNDRIIAVWLDEGVTRVINSDYFDESKKAGLRMWSSRVYESGGLVLHAGCKVIPSSGGPKPMLIVGLPDTGKSTITFTQQKGSKVLQDDFVALLPRGHIVSSQDGCIEKTYGLEARLQPAIYHAVTQPDAYLENVLQRGNLPDFSRETDRRAGRAVFNFRSIDAWPADQVPQASSLVILHRDETVMPAVARLDLKGAIRHFLLRELHGWTAKDAHGEGSLPGPRADQSLLGIAQRGQRLGALLASHPIEAYLVNTGRVGGPAADPRSKEIAFNCSFAIVEAIAEGSIIWESDEELGYEIASSVPGVDEPDLLQPRRLYESQRRMDEYRERLTRLKTDWRLYLAALPLDLSSLVSSHTGRRS